MGQGSSYRSPQNTALRGSAGGVCAADLQSAAPAGGAPARHQEVRTRAPAAPAPSSSSARGGDAAPQGEPRPQRTAPNPQSPTLKPLFLSVLSDLRPRRLRLGEAWVQQRPPSHPRRRGSQGPGLRGSGCGRPPPLPDTDPSFPVPGSPHLNFGGARAAKLSADLQRTPAPAAHRAPGEEREVGGEGEGAGLGGVGGGPWPDTYRLSGVLRAATAAAAARPRGRGGAGSCAPLRAPPPRCAPLQPRRLLARVRSRSHAAAAGPRRGGGGARSTCPSSPSPRPKLKNNKKQLITPERSAARRAESAA